MEGRLTGATGGDRYQRYAQSLAEPGVSQNVLSKYPVLGRLVMTVLDNWVDASAEFMKRLTQDWRELTLRLPTLRDGDRLVAFEALGDPHCGGRRVAVCRFESGAQLVYKPRSVRNDINFQELLRWVNERSEIPSLQTLEVIDRGVYGWVEFAAAHHCQSRFELQRFYRRQGAYIAILHVLAAQDFHYENVIAAGEQPLMVDLESILQPALVPDADDLAPAERALASELWSDSVLRIGLLPSRTFSRDDHELDLSGLGAVSDQITPMRFPRWADEGTDDMHQTLSEANLGYIQSSPIAPDEHLSIADFVEDIVEGFVAVYELFAANRETLLAPNGPLAAFAHEETRRIVRPSMAYAMLLQSGCHPHFLADGLSRELQFDRLLSTQPLSGQHRHARIAAAERKDLWNLDIPRFTTRPDSRDLWSSSGERIPRALSETGLEAVRRRIRRMSDDERELQTWMIRTSIATSSLSATHGRRAQAESAGRQGIESNGEPLAAATEIGDRLARSSIRSGGTAMWIGLASQGGERWGISPVGPDLYEGLAGIAMFLAYLGWVSSEQQYVDLARAAVRTLRTQYARGTLDRSIGGFAGLGGHVYASTHLAATLDDDDLLLEAESAVAKIASLVDDDEGLDVIAGSAGSILALLALNRVRPRDDTLAVAVRCGERLLATAVETDEGLAWQRDEIAPRPLGGLGHGTAGFAWALFELFGATSDQRFRQAAIEAIRHDRSLFSPLAGNWLDLREDISDGREQGDDDHRCLAFWCHGSTGIGLTRMRCRRYWDDGAMHSEIDAAIDATIRHGFGSSHCLCHGDFGNLELLSMACRESPNSRLRADLARLSGESLASIEEHGCISGHILGLESPGLMMGSAGVGYGLLRLAVPERVPSVLLLDPPHNSVVGVDARSHGSGRELAFVRDGSSAD
jgi:type 2 lantibiotic biosynthesis protein LanM